MDAESTNFHVRPRFKRIIPHSPGEIEDRISMALKGPDTTCKGNVIPGHATIKIPQEQRHYWSPQLQLSFEETDEGTVLRGLFGPQPHVWTMFVLFYSVIGFAILVLLVLGMSYMSLGKSAQILWGVPVLLAVFLTLYLVAYFGQRRSRHQLHVLNNFILAALNLEVEEKV